MKWITLFICLMAGSTAFGQTAANTKTIAVSGSAETELVPDEIYVRVDLKEYEKKGAGKIGLAEIRNQFYRIIREAGLKDSAVSIAGYEGSTPNPWIKKKKSKDELYAGQSFQLKLRSPAEMDAVVERLDENATQNFYVVRTTHSRLTEWRRQLKIDAVKAAKEKAAYLASAIGENIGGAISITEPSESQIYPGYINMRTSNSVVAQDDSGSSEGAQIDFKKIRLRYEVNVTFALR